MKIGIDVTGLGVRKEGIVSYTANITNRMLAIESGHTFYLYCRTEVPKIIEESLGAAQVRIIGASNRKIAQQFYLPSSAKADDLDVLFFPFNSAALRCPSRSVVTIHDLQPFVLPNQFADVHDSSVYKSRIKRVVNRTYWRMMLKWASLNATRVIAVSEATKRDIVEIFGVPGNVVDVVHEGVNHENFNLNDDGVDPVQFRRRYGLPNNYILCVGVNPYKNIEGSLDAFKLTKESIPNGVKLILVGNNYFGERLFSMLSSRGLTDDVIVTGFFPDDDLKYLYQCADLFLFPSFYEGFGLPVLESFACGTPVLTSSTRGSLEEVSGGAAVLADPRDAASIADGIVSLYSDQKLRHKVTQLGLERAAEFSWERAAEGTLCVLERSIC